MVAAGNTFGIKSLRDLVDKDVRLINRQPYSGTRELLEELLSQEGISSSSIQSFDQHEYTHTAVAAQVATGMADVGFGMEAAAARFDLDFIPITEDAYLWAIKIESENDPEVLSFIEMLKSEGFQEEVNALPGYQCDDAGVKVSLDELLG